MYTITLHIPVSKIRTKAEAEDFALAILQHLHDTFNDDGSMHTVQADYHVKRVKKV